MPILSKMPSVSGLKKERKFRLTENKSRSHKIINKALIKLQNKHANYKMIVFLEGEIYLQHSTRKRKNNKKKEVYELPLLVKQIIQCLYPSVIDDKNQISSSLCKHLLNYFVYNWCFGQSLPICCSFLYNHLKKI